MFLIDAHGSDHGLSVEVDRHQVTIRQWAECAECCEPDDSGSYSPHIQTATVDLRTLLDPTGRHMGSQGSSREVFGLTGGELDDKPWEPWEPQPQPLSDREADHVLSGVDTWSHHASDRLSFRYSYDGVPDWAGRSEFPDMHDNGVSYRTVVLDCLFGLPPEVLHDRGEIWTRVASYRSSGETECSLGDGNGAGRSIVGSEDWRDDLIVFGGKEPFDREERCPLCETESGEPHGYIYLGDGWCEVVYRTQVFYCPDCGDEVEHDDDDPRDADDQVCDECSQARGAETPDDEPNDDKVT